MVDFSKTLDTLVKTETATVLRLYKLYQENGKVRAVKTAADDLRLRNKTETRTRLRYYVSHRLIRNSGAKNKDGWRFPAVELETKVASVIAKRFNSPLFIGTLIPDATAAEIAKAKAGIDAIGN